ncbi:hypothetical protein [Sorangium sp. So ce1097]|uniref:hypothetical protein n=1 Tax=Sorangium sp. So ce1097 TaxID=3133330 RepID=UPI003F605880
MPWLWYVGPLALLVVWYLTGLRGRHESRRDAELVRWRALMTPQPAARRPAAKGGGRKTTAEVAGPRPVRSMPSSLERTLQETGGGAVVARYELVPKLAYVAVVGPDAKNGSEYQVVLAKLAKPAPRLTACPLPILDGQRVPNTGIQFRKDPDFMDQFLVEGPEAKAIGRWLSKRVRDALRDLPDAWLLVQDRVMALAAYGPVDAERMEELVIAADAIFAEHGSEGAPSLLFEDDSDEDDDEDDDEGDEDDEDDEDEGDDEDDGGEEDEAPASAPAGNAKQGAPASGSSRPAPRRS